MGKSTRMQNTAGYGKDILDAVAHNSSAQAKSAAAVALAKKDDAKLIEKILDTLLASASDSDQYLKSVSIKNNNIILGRIATLLDEVLLEHDETASFSDDQIKQLKDSIVELIKAEYPDGLASHNDVKSVEKDVDDVSDAIIDALVLMSNERKKDVQDIKETLSQMFSSGSGEGSESSSFDSNKFGNKKVESIEDETEGDYQDSTIAQNFQTLQNAIDKQLEAINNNVKNLTGFSILGGFVGFATKGIGAILSGVKSVTGKVTSLTKNVVSKVFNISKAIGSGALSAISKSIKGITKGIGSVVGAVGKIGKGIGAGFAKIGNGIKSFGAKVGGAIAHPFKAIGGFFKNRKKDKAEAKKEKLREKFMNFMMKAFEKLWDFLEPILSKLKIFMLIALVPILTTAATVIAIIAGLVAIVVGAWILWNIIKKKALQFWNYIVSGEMLDDIIAGLKKAWDWLCDFGKWLWDLTIDALKYIFVDVWVDLGKWLWKKLCEFGNWLYNKWIYPYIVQPINDHIIKPLRELWENKIKPIVQPFIDSLMNLKNRLVAIWQKFQWDENKSFFENLKCLASIVKDAVLDWWNTSPFKTFYETYLDPIIKSVHDLIQRIKNIWNNFNWDENKSFLENLKAFWDECWSAIKSWWEGSTIKKYWDMLTDWLSNIWQKVKDWWNGTSIGKWINSLQQKIENLKQKLSKVFVHIPGWGGGKNIYPFAPAVGKPFIIDAKDDKEAMAKKRDEEIADLKQKIASGKKRNWLTGTNYEKELARLEAQKKAEQQESLAQQQVQNAMQPVNNINNMNSNTNVELQKAGEEMSTKAAAAEQATQDYRQQQSIIGSQSLAELHDMREEMRKGFKDPAVVPMPMPYGPQRNAAMMYNEETY